jgi:uncharacterized protein
MRFTVRVQPGARRSHVGGRYGDARPPVLLARIAAPATDGRANKALITALAQAFDVRREQVRIVAGAAGRTKLIDIDAPVSGALAALLSDERRQ